MASNFTAFELRAHRFSAFIDILTPNTYILVVMPANAAESTTTLMNIATCRKHFEKLEVIDKAVGHSRGSRNASLQGAVEDMGYGRR